MTTKEKNPDLGPVPGKNFDQWLQDILPEVGDAQKALEEDLSRDHSQLSSQASITENLYARMTEILSESDAFLDWFEYVELMKIDRELTVSERNVILKAKVAQQRMLRDKLRGLAEALKARMRRAQWNS